MRFQAGLIGVLAAGLTAALSAAGCGTSTLSAGQLRNYATKTCNLARRRTDQIPTPSTPSGGISFLSRGIAALAPQQATLEALRPPADLAGEYRTALEASRMQLAALRVTLTELKAGNDPVDAIKSLQSKLSPLEAKGDAAWQSVGIPACADR
jgi:hypothetical protein